METFDDITCEEYALVYGTLEDNMQDWVEACEQDANCELRELAA
jgi:hypothetical protein